MGFVRELRSEALRAPRNSNLWCRSLFLLLLSHLLAWKLAYNWEGLLHTQFLLWYTMMAVFLLNLFLNFSSKKPKSLIVVVLTAQFSPNRVILIGCAQSCNIAQWWMKKFGFKIKLDNLYIKLSKLKLGHFGCIRWLTNSIFHTDFKTVVGFHICLQRKRQFKIKKMSKWSRLLFFQNNFTRHGFYM